MKISILVFLCALLLTASLCSCESAADDNITDTFDETTTQISNPFIGCESLEAAGEIAGFEISVPESIYGDSEEISINAIDGKMIEIICKSGTEQTRIRKAVGNEDISSDYNDYDRIETIELNGYQITTKGSNDVINAAIWANDTFSFAIDTIPGFDINTIAKLIESIA